MPRDDKASRAQYNAQYKLNNAEKILSYQASYREKNKELIAQKRKLRAEANKEYARMYRINNKDKVRETKKKYVESVRSHINCYAATRRAEKEQRTPKWLTFIDFERIKNEYRLAEIQTKLTGEPWHVDHIIPLKGKTVSGLHVPSNLRAIRGSENMKKHNEFEVNYA